MTSISQNRSEIVTIGLFGAISVVLGFIENFIPLPVPGVRLGLANLGVMMMFYIGGTRPALIVMILKICLVPLLSGNIFFRLSLAGPSGIMAFIGMYLVFRFMSRYTSSVSMGVVGAVLHMLTQLFMIDAMGYINGIFNSGIVSWFLLAAAVTGILTGVITALTVSRISPLLPYETSVIGLRPPDK